METFESKVTSKGQITLPARLRSGWQLKSGDKVVFHRDEDGTVRVEALTASLGLLRGIVRKAPGPIDGEQLASWIKASRGARWRDPSELT